MDGTKTLEAIAELVSNKKNADDLLSAVQAVLKIFAELKDANAEERTEILARFEALKSGIDKRVVALKDGPMGPQGPRGDKGDSIQGPKGDRGERGDIGPQGPAGDIKELSPDEIRDALELLQGDERLDASAIKGLEEFVKAHGGSKGGYAAVSGRGHIKSYDLSPYLDGSTRTFNLPAMWGIISVAASSTPGALRPVIDYVGDYSNHSITFTSQIDETTTLAEGQTIIIVYEEA